ncbi:MED6 [Mytilus edulis]|uniref:Mediator of RNA polymerase II transcription subunit 6 n=1 Tax=Mytilus edulis TaxID=6550 RepID=A0A8S3PS17_MYTED|nr:MED6 [Mytilus edulis]
MSLDKDNPLGISWHDTAWIPLLNPNNILDYFGERSNPFYDRTCNNEIIKMQRLSQDQLNNMTGLEYMLLHVQEPILYVVRKQHRHSPQQVTPLADYYIIAGVVYQAPDLGSVINSRLLNTLFNLQSAFVEAQSFSRYTPSKGYWWEFSDQEDKSEKSDSKEKKKNLAQKFPPKVVPPTQPEVKEEPVKQEPVIKQEIKQERPDDKSNTSIKPPPDKKPKLMR